MPDLLHEFWRDDDGGSFGPVNADRDALRINTFPKLRYVFEIRAGSWREAMRLYEERAYGEFGKSYDHFPDTIYTDEDLAEQKAFLRTRTNVR